MIKLRIAVLIAILCCGFSRGLNIALSTTGNSAGTCGAKLLGGATQPFWIDNSCQNAVYDCSGASSTQTIGTLTNQTVPQGIFANWTMPIHATFTNINICGAPRFTIGYQFGGNASGITPPASTPIPSALTIDSLSSLKFSFNINLVDLRTSNGGYEELFFEMYPANAAGTGVSLSREFSVVMHIDAGSYAYYGPGGGCITDVTCTVHVNYTGPVGCPYVGYMVLLPGNTSGGNTGGQIIMMPRDGHDILTGCVDVKDMFAFAVAQGAMPSGKFLNGVEFLSELYANTGSWRVNCLSYDWNGTTYGATSC